MPRVSRVIEEFKVLEADYKVDLFNDIIYYSQKGYESYGYVFKDGQSSFYYSQIMVKYKTEKETEL